MPAGRSAVVATSRELVQDDGAGGLAIGQRVTDALCAIVARLDAFLETFRGELARMDGAEFRAHAAALGALCAAHLSANRYDYGRCPQCGLGALRMRAASKGRARLSNPPQL